MLQMTNKIYQGFTLLAMIAFVVQKIMVLIEAMGKVAQFVLACFSN